MFNEKEKNVQNIETLIGERCTVNGTLSGSGVLKLDGSIKGNIDWKDDVIIGDNSISTGDIKCINAYIGGTLNGNAICENSLVIESCGRVVGDINVKTLSIKEGGILDGKCTMSGSSSEKGYT